MDFIIGKLFYTTIGRPHGFLMKKDWFFFPLGYLLKYMGGIPVNRSKKEDLVEKLSQYIHKKKELHIGITPEGTRSYRSEWKSGFYRIALAAGIPIQLAVIDYKNKEVGIFEVFNPTGDMEQDIDYIRRQYHKYQAKYPEKFHEYND